ncbi:MAG TPA: O-antigen ligase family protein [Trebonia sp.]|nr:O-antigen ligase family protein [Trebonia sp.]
MFLNVVPFYKGTWNQLPLIIPIPSVIGKLMTQGALPLALLLVLSVNRRRLIRPNLFLTLLTLLVIAAIIAGVDPNAGRFISTAYRTFRLAAFVVTLWMLSPLWDRQDMLLVKCQLAALFTVLGTVLLGFMVAPGRALAQGRLSGEFWPITPVQVSDYAAVALGILIVLWFCGETRGRVTLLVGLAVAVMLFMTHTRTELVALFAGLLVAGLRMYTSRVRRLLTIVAITVSVAIIGFSSALTTWLARGQSTEDLTNLTGRTNAWAGVLSAPRDRFQVIFGYGLSNKSVNGLPIDSNWLAAYYDLGIVGIAICISMLLFVLITAYFRPRSPQIAIALFLVVYLIITSLTETGLSDASDYLLELALAASLLTPVRNNSLLMTSTVQFMPPKVRRRVA